MVSSQQPILAALCETPPCSVLRISCYGTEPHCCFSSLACGEPAMPLAPSLCLQEPMRIPRLARDYFKPFLVASAHDPKPADTDTAANYTPDRPPATNTAAAHPADFHAAGLGDVAPVNDVPATQSAVANTAAENEAYTPAGEKDDGETPAALETTVADDPAAAKTATHPAKEGVVNKIAAAHDAAPPNDVVCAATIIEGLLSSHAAPVVQFAQAWPVQVANNLGASLHAATPDGALDLLAANPVESITVEADILLAPCCHDAFPAAKDRAAFNSTVPDTTIQAFLESLAAEEPALVKSIHAWPVEVATHQAAIHAPEAPQQLPLEAAKPTFSLGASFYAANSAPLPDGTILATCVDAYPALLPHKQVLIVVAAPHADEPSVAGAIATPLELTAREAKKPSLAATVATGGAIKETKATVANLVAIKRDGAHTVADLGAALRSAKNATKDSAANNGAGPTTIQPPSEDGNGFKTIIGNLAAAPPIVGATAKDLLANLTTPHMVQSTKAWHDVSSAAHPASHAPVANLDIDVTTNYKPQTSRLLEPCTLPAAESRLRQVKPQVVELDHEAHPSAAISCGPSFPPSWSSIVFDPGGLAYKSPPLHSQMIPRPHQ